MLGRLLGVPARLAYRWERPAMAEADLATLVMGVIALVTAGTGLAYLLPDQLFGTSPAFAVLRDNGGETFWGVVLWTVGWLGLIATWLEWQTARLEREGRTTLEPQRMPGRRFGRLAWNLTSITWAFVGTSFFYSSWALSGYLSPGGIAYAGIAAIAQIIAVTARKRRDAGLGGDGGATGD